MGPESPNFITDSINSLSLSAIKELGKQVVLYVETTYPELKGAAKKAKATELLVELLEKFDDKIFWLGQFADYPLVDWLEKWAVGLLVDWAWGVLLAAGLVESSTIIPPPAPEPTAVPA
jgi:hypothetical protein